MNTSPVSLPRTLAMLAQVMERLERSAGPVDADQFRAVVGRLAAELRSTPRDAGFEAILAHCPGVAELYENLQYEHAGLCRSPLDQAMSAEMAARAAIERARGGTLRAR